MSLYAPAPRIDRRLLLAGGLAGLLPLGACTGRLRINAAPGTPAAMARAAQDQLGVTTDYDAGYRALTYPGGDPPRKTGACCDVIVRAARDGLGLDLQKLVHEDMSKAFDAYPATWGLARPDVNIDHRRVPNLETYFQRAGGELWRAKDRETDGASFPGELETGDILTWREASGTTHIALVTRGGKRPLILHNFGRGVVQHGLGPMGFRRAAHGHYRWSGSVA
ncbi:DUF1287 domain-containing protein [Brevundimonas sp. M20]|uniref:DUF1287 domain-containing protein n=1 Tax=Brevundimonas sp. M20 TaxID=2591463 RepID=UPI00197A8250|nr:DUF1287 domain-containing protein [Brevundimonas sp. M20]